MDVVYEKSEIPKYLIDRCEELSIEEDKTYFIFDKSISNLVRSREVSEKQEKREIILNELIESDDKFHIGTETYFKEMPSRFSYYDTETKETNRYLRYKMVTDFLEKIGFEPNREFNFGLDYEQSYIISSTGDPLSPYITARIKPNLFLSIKSTDSASNILYIFDGFFSIPKILDSFNRIPNFTQIIRDIKIYNILR